MREKLKKLFQLFFIMMKIGLFTFGGGYAMIALLENEFVGKRHWIDNNEFSDMVAIAESTPGPIAINSATFIGYKQGGILGSVVSTVGVCIPSFVIIYLISLFFNAFLEIGWVAAAFKGIQVGVIFLILSAGVKMLIKLPKTVSNILVALATFVCMILFSIFAVDFSSIFYILISAAVGLMIFLIKQMKNRKKEDGKDDLS